MSHFPGLKLDAFVNAVIPVFSYYQETDISLDPKGLSSMVELVSTETKVYPRKGAIVLANFDSLIGYPLLLIPEGKSVLPFGSEIKDENNHTLGLVGQGGLIYVRVPGRTGNLVATFNIKGKPQRCLIPWHIETNHKTPAQSLQIRQRYHCEIQKDNPPLKQQTQQPVKTNFGG